MSRVPGWRSLVRSGVFTFPFVGPVAPLRGNDCIGAVQRVRDAIAGGKNDIHARPGGTTKSVTMDDLGIVRRTSIQRKHRGCRA